MTVGPFLNGFFNRDIRISVSGNSLEVDAPANELTDEDLDRLRDRRSEVIRFLRLANGLPADDEAACLLSMELVEPFHVPECAACDRLCDTERLDGQWRCSHCDPDAPSRRERTLRWLRVARTIAEANNRGRAFSKNKGS